MVIEPEEYNKYMNINKKNFETMKSKFKLNYSYFKNLRELISFKR